MKKGTKYRNTRTVYNGYTYHSKKEAEYAKNLDWKIKAGEVVNWERQVPFSFKYNGVHIGKYILDFRVYYKDGRIEHIDVKGYREGVAYHLFILKKRLMFALFDIIVLEQ